MIKCVLLDGGTLPTRGSAGAACWDMYAAEDVLLWPGQAAAVRLGVRVELPAKHVLLLLPRSGLSFKNQILLPNSAGVIDEDYRGELRMTMLWLPGEHAPGAFKVRKGDRIAQALLVKYEQQDWEVVNELSATERGTGGFGSTGL